VPVAHGQGVGADGGLSAAKPDVAATDMDGLMEGYREIRKSHC